MSTKMVYFVYFIIKCRDSMLMVTAEVPSETSAARWTVDDVLSGSIVIVRILITDLGAIIAKVDKVEVCGRDIEVLISQIS